MENAILPTTPFYWLMLRCLVVYAVLLVLLRWSGKRQVTQMGAAELMALLMLSDAVQNSMVGTDSSLLGGLICAATLLGISVVLEYAGFRSKRVEQIIEGAPTVVIYRGKVCWDEMRHEWLSRHDLRQMLREQGIATPAEVDLAVLESDGSLSIIKRARSADHDASPQDQSPTPNERVV